METSATIHVGMHTGTHLPFLLCAHTIITSKDLLNGKSTAILLANLCKKQQMHLVVLIN